MRRVYWFGAVGVLLTACFWGAPAAQVLELLGGVVLDAAGAPIEGATVTLRNELTAEEKATLTDKAGAFLFGSLVPATYVVGAAKAGWVPMEFGATRYRGLGTPLVVPLPSAQGPISIQLHRGGVIGGVVLRADGVPLAGGAMTLFEERIDSQGGMTLASAGSARTDHRGIYRFFGLGSGRYVLRVTPTETAATSQGLIFPPTFWPGTPFAEAAGRIGLAPSVERTNIDVSVVSVPSASLTGNVVDDSGRPVILEVGDVEFQRLERGGIISRAQRAKVSGDVFSIADAFQGDYVLTARGKRGGPNDQAVEGHLRVSVGTSAVDYLRLVVRPVAIIRGRVVLSGQQHEPGVFDRVRVTLDTIGDRENPARLIRPGTDGSFIVSDLSPGRYRLDTKVTTIAEPMWLVETIVIASRDVADSYVDIVAGVAVPAIEIRLVDRLGELSGQVLDRAGQPSTQHTVVAFPQDRELWSSFGRRIRAVRPSSIGRFTIRGLPPGEYRLGVLSDPEPNEWLRLSVLESLASSSVTATVIGRSTTTQDLIVEKRTATHSVIHR